MAGVALSRMISGAVEGIDRGMARRDRDTARKREDEQYQQGQEDRTRRQSREDYSLARQSINDTRADKQYKTQEDARKRKVAGNDAIRNWMTTGEVEALNKYANEYTAEGVEHSLKKNPDGTYSGSIDYEGKKTPFNNISEDDVGTYVHQLMAEDPYQSLVAEKAGKQKAMAKADERSFELKKMEKEYALKRGLAQTKGEISGKGTAGGKVPDYQKTIMKTSSQIYGGTYDSTTGIFSFENDGDREKSSIHSELAIAHYLSSDSEEPISAAASRKAQRDVTEFEAAARQYAEQELDSGAIDKDQYDSRINELMHEYADNEIKKLSQESTASLSRAVPEKSKTYPVTINGKQGEVTEEEIAFTAEAEGVSVEEVKKALGIAQ